MVTVNNQIDSVSLAKMNNVFTERARRNNRFSNGIIYLLNEFIHKLLRLFLH